MWNQLEVQGEEGAGCSLVGVKGSHHLHPDSRKEKRWKGQKKKKKELWGNGVTGERAALGTPHHRCSAAAA